MKKIVALVLAMVMVLGLATTAFAALPVWTENGSTLKVDLFDGKYNTKIAEGGMTFTTAKAPTYNTDGTVKTVGHIAHYTFNDGVAATPTDLETCYYVLVDSIPADAVATDYVLVKVHDKDLEPGDKLDVLKQTAANQVRIMKKVAAVDYIVTAELFTAWGTKCGQYEAPEATTPPTKYASFTYAKVPYVVDVYAATEDVAGVLIGNDVYVVGDDFQTPLKHVWFASAWNEKTGAATEYTCDVCKTVAKVINASVNAPAGYTVEKLPDNTLIAFQYTPGVEAPAEDTTVTSPKTFDAGIAMYVGMSVMAAAGSAVVLKKKD